MSEDLMTPDELLAHRTAQLMDAEAKIRELDRKLLWRGVDIPPAELDRLASISEAKEAVCKAAKLWRSVVDPATTADVHLAYLVDALIKAENS